MALSRQQTNPNTDSREKIPQCTLKSSGGATYEWLNARTPGKHCGVEESSVKWEDLSTKGQLQNLQKNHRSSKIPCYLEHMRNNQSFLNTYFMDRLRKMPSFRLYIRYPSPVEGRGHPCAFICSQCCPMLRGFLATIQFQSKKHSQNRQSNLQDFCKEKYRLIRILIIQ